MKITDGGEMPQVLGDRIGHVLTHHPEHTVKLYQDEGTVQGWMEEEADDGDDWLVEEGTGRKYVLQILFPSDTPDEAVR